MQNQRVPRPEFLKLKYHICLERTHLFIITEGGVSLLIFAEKEYVGFPERAI